MSAEILRGLAENNSKYVSKHETPWTMGNFSMRPAIILACMDPRCNPAEFWDFPNAKGPAVLRNAGGRAREVMTSIRTLSGIAGGADNPIGLGAVAVVHHTDCGLLNYNAEFVKCRTKERVDGAELKAEVDSMSFYGFTDLEDSVREDMAIIKNDPFLPKDLEVIGFVYDVVTGKTREVGESGFTDAGTTCDLAVTRP